MSPATTLYTAALTKMVDCFFFVCFLTKQQPPGRPAGWVDIIHYPLHWIYKETIPEGRIEGEREGERERGRERERERKREGRKEGGRQKGGGEG